MHNLMNRECHGNGTFGKKYCGFLFLCVTIIYVLQIHLWCISFLVLQTQFLTVSVTVRTKNGDRWMGSSGNAAHSCSSDSGNLRFSTHFRVLPSARYNNVAGSLRLSNHRWMMKYKYSPSHTSAILEYDRRHAVPHLPQAKIWEC